MAVSSAERKPSVTPPQKLRDVLCMTLNCIRWWGSSFGECGVPHHCCYSQFHSQISVICYGPIYVSTGRFTKLRVVWLRIHWLCLLQRDKNLTKERCVLGMMLNCWWWGSSSRHLRSVEWFRYLQRKKTDRFFTR